MSCKGQEIGSNHLAPWSWPECILCFYVFMLGQLRDFLEFASNHQIQAVCLNHTWGHVAIRADIKLSKHKAPHYLFVLFLPLHFGCSWARTEMEFSITNLWIYELALYKVPSALFTTTKVMKVNPIYNWCIGAVLWQAGFLHYCPAICLYSCFKFKLIY